MALHVCSCSADYASHAREVGALLSCSEFWLCLPDVRGGTVATPAHQMH